ncbi:hypothetical protein AFL01nite_15160 [Aeromicrobium flavum]|uniref:Lipoprotein n=1 Tax=Aeromicrobium flavum TaxID=416568 RepID=A0A512HUQ5_9ACTN|nr:hypothetical protein [Aeromicrobium flavum]GEO89189.1 hypothetical protein AFL01nite_15160 [Aeromicrobium flavum]
MRTLIRLAVLPILALALTACGDPDDNGGASAGPMSEATFEPSRGLPEGVEKTLDSPAGVVVGTDGQIHVVTYGSSSNPAVVRQVRAEGQTVTVQVSAVEGRAATMDYVPTTSTFILPDSVDPKQPITFELSDFGPVEIAAAEPGAEAWVERPE